MRYTLKKIKRFIITVTGFTVLAIGTLLIILPGPAFIVIPLGLSILATEYVWAQTILSKVKTKLTKNKTKESRL